jgi:AP2-associated kinase
MNSHLSGGLRPIGQHSYSKDGVRSEQVTGIAMRESKGTKGEGVQRRPVEELTDAGIGTPLKRTTRPTRPSLSRKHRSSISIKHPHQSGNDVLGSPALASPAGMTSPRFPEPKDWLTGNDDGLTAVAAKSTSAETPVLREFTNKRASFIEATSTDIQSPQEVVTAEQLPSLTSPILPKAKYATPKASRPLPSPNTTSVPKVLS